MVDNVLREKGLTAVWVADHVIVFGGIGCAACVWGCHVDTATWRRIPCGGQLPPPRLHHTAVVVGRCMVVFGGDIIGDPRSRFDANMVPGHYELDLDTFQWALVQTQGKPPAPRTHHTAVVRGNQMFLFGGRSTLQAPSSLRSMLEDASNGFFDIYVLDVLHRTWTAQASFRVDAPRLFGHSCVAFGEYLIMFGGFVLVVSSVDLQWEALNGPPPAVLSDTVYIYHTRTCEWRQCTASVQEGTYPTARAHHTAHLYGTDMLLHGGLALTDTGHMLWLHDCWIYRIDTGMWRSIDFGLPYGHYPRGGQAISTLLGSVLVVMSDVMLLCSLDLQRLGAGWIRPVQCSVLSDSVIAPDDPITDPPEAVLALLDEHQALQRRIRDLMKGQSEQGTGMLSHARGPHMSQITSVDNRHTGIALEADNVSDKLVALQRTLSEMQQVHDMQCKSHSASDEALMRLMSYGYERQDRLEHAESANRFRQRRSMLE